MTTLTEYNEDLALFVEAGMVAIKQGDEESARKLFNAVKIVDADNENVDMGFGLIALHKMDLSVARKHFEKLAKGPTKHWRAQAFLSLAHVLSIMKDESGEAKLKSLQTAYALAQEVIEKCEDDTIKQLAQSVLDWEKEMQQKGK
jgi:tetratricopeptide (TPR) repeat protein